MTDSQAADNSISSEIQSLRLQIKNLTERNDDLTATINSLREKESLYRLLETNINDVLAILDINLKYRYISPSVFKQRGFTPDELINQAIFERLPRESIQKLKNLFAREIKAISKANGKVFRTKTVELEVYHKNGQLIQIESTVSIIADHNGKPNALLAVSRDVTERKKTQQALIDSENRYKVLFTDSLESLSLSYNGVFVDVNNAWLILHGYESLDHIVGKNVIEIIHPEDHKILLNRREKRYSNNVPRIIEIRDVCSDGSSIDVEVQSTTILIGNRRMILAAVRDITERKRNQAAIKFMHDNLRQKAQELEASNRELSRYAYMVSHNLKTPLRAMKHFSRFLKEELSGSLNAEQTEYLTGIEISVENARRLIDDLLILTRIERHELIITSVNLSLLIRSVIEQYKGENHEFHIPDEFPEVQGEKILLEQIFDNIICNALKYNRSMPKKVSIHWEYLSENTISIAISDNGIGIESDYFCKIFDSFTRLHASDEFEGSGLGLAIVKSAIDRLCGSVTVESQSGVGSTFIISLPRFQS